MVMAELRARERRNEEMSLVINMKPSSTLEVSIPDYISRYEHW